MNSQDDRLVQKLMKYRSENREEILRRLIHYGELDIADGKAGDAQKLARFVEECKKELRKYVN